MSLKRLLLLLSLIMSFIPLTANAQTPPTEKTAEQKEEAKKELDKKALGLLDSLVEDARTLRVPENRVRILAGAADLLWPRDEKRARAVFRELAAHINEAAQRAKSGDGERRERVFWSVIRLREEVLKTVARRDPALALELLHATRQPPNYSSTNSGGFQQPDAELNLENQIIVQVAARDPKRALEMAEASLAKGVSFETNELLQRLHNADPEAGKKFAGEMVRKIRAENLKKNRIALYVAAQLLSMASGRSVGFIRVGSGQASVVGGKPLTLGPEAMRDLLDALVSAVLTERGDAVLDHLLQPHMPEIEKFWPERAALLRALFDKIRREQDPQERAWSQYAPLWEQDSPEALLEAAQKAPANMREQLYTVAAWKAAGKGDLDRARQIVNDNLQNSSERVKMLESLEQAALTHSLHRGKIEEARVVVARIRSKEKRAAALAGLAVLAATKGDKKLAQQLLEEARPLVGDRPKNVEQLNLHLQLARAYALVEPARSFEIVEAIVERANEMIAAADVLDGFLGGPEIFRSGELVMHSGLASLENIFEQYGKELAALARADFDRANSAAGRFQRTEVRTMARLLIAQGLLSDREPSGATPEELLGGQTGVRGR